MTEMEDRVLSAMKDEGRPMKGGEIADALGVDRKDVDKAMNSLKKTGAITSPKRCFWEPSD
jgi:biotin operon repressor